VILHDLLEKDIFTSLKNKLSVADVWSERPLTGVTNNPKFKNNKEYIGEQLVEEYCLMNEVQNNILWREYVAAPKQSSRTIFLRYDQNNHYKKHTDTSKGFDGALHYTNIYFISDPEEYEGGEFCLKINEEVFKYKLKKNSLLTYPINTEHWVTPIIKGVRYVGIFWTQSYINQEEDRRMLRELTQINRLVMDYIESNLNNGDHITDHELAEVTIKLENIAERINQKYPRYRGGECPLISE
jgi:predicted 2-oxoglutarate/Fe(II)-dependent dioxygenase YbiX